jgi:hypothetical protein
MKTAPSSKALRELLAIAGISFALNFVWEHVHSLLYVHYKGGPITNWILFHATLGDMVMLTTFALPFVFYSWWHKRPWLIVPIGFVTAVLIEWYALGAGRWAYGEHMPIVPIVETGLTPTVQLALLGYITYRLVLSKYGNAHPAHS